MHLHPLQSVLNAAARFVIKLRSSSIMYRSQEQFSCTGHRSTQRIIFKLCLLVYKRQHHRAPSYMSSLCVPLSSVTTRRHMPAATQGDLNFPRTRTVTLGPRAFAFSGPMCWNSLPSAMKSSSLQPEQFRRQLKTTLMAQPL